MFSWAFIEKKFGRTRIIDPFDYQYAKTSLAASGTDTFTITVGGDHNFLLCAINGYLFTTGTIKGFTLKLTIGANDFSDGAIHNRTFAGDASNQYPLPFPRLIMANESLKGEVVNLDTAQAANIYISFIGCRLFAKETPEQRARRLAV